MRQHAIFLLAMAFFLPMAAAFAGEGAGDFIGVNGHKATGRVEVVQTADGWELHLKDDFTFDGAPDPWVGFGTLGKFSPGTDFYRLRANTGGQLYKVPADINPADYDEVYIWCRQYSVALGVARIGD